MSKTLFYITLKTKKKKERKKEKEKGRKEGRKKEPKLLRLKLKTISMS